MSPLLFLNPASLLGSMHLMLVNPLMVYILNRQKPNPIIFYELTKLTKIEKRRKI